MYSTASAAKARRVRVALSMVGSEDLKREGGKFCKGEDNLFFVFFSLHFCFFDFPKTRCSYIWAGIFKKLFKFGGVFLRLLALRP